MGHSNANADLHIHVNTGHVFGLNGGGAGYDAD